MGKKKGGGGWRRESVSRDEENNTFFENDMSISFQTPNISKKPKTKEEHLKTNRTEQSFLTQMLIYLEAIILFYFIFWNR